MNIDALTADRLNADHLAAWYNIQRADWVLQNPFFSPELTLATAELRNDVEVAVFRQDGQYVGFLPFHRNGNRIGTPVADRISELHGPIASADLQFSGKQLLQETNLSAWQFGCTTARQAAMQPYCFSQSKSPFIDLSNGFEAYRKERRHTGSSQIEQALRKERKIHRELGPLRFEMHTDDDRAMKTLLEWKSQQYRRTGTLDMFRLDWIVGLLEKLRRIQTDQFAGVLSALYLNDRMIAVHFGIRSRDVLAWWFPSYDDSLAKYSPGSILLTNVLQQAAAEGIVRVDLGQGDERYKASFMTDAFEVMEGSIGRRSVNRLLHRGWVQTRNWAQSSRLGRTPLRMFRGARNWMIQK